VSARRRVHALVLRYVLLVGRDPSRVVDLVVWPFIDITVWGFLTMYVNQTGSTLPNAMAIFLGGAILWNVFLRASQDASVSFLDDVWARSVVTLFASPLRLVEYGASLMAVGVIKVILGLSAMGVAAWGLYAFDLLSFGPWLLPFAANLVLFGYTLGLVALAMIVRFGGAGRSSRGACRGSSCRCRRSTGRSRSCRLWCERSRRGAR